MCAAARSRGRRQQAPARGARPTSCLPAHHAPAIRQPRPRAAARPRPTTTHLQCLPTAAARACRPPERALCLPSHHATCRSPMARARHPPSCPDTSHRHPGAGTAMLAADITQTSALHQLPGGARDSPAPPLSHRRPRHWRCRQRRRSRRRWGPGAWCHPAKGPVARTRALHFSATMGWTMTGLR